MLVFLVILSAISFVLGIISGVLQRKNIINLHMWLSLVKGGCDGAIFGLLLVVLIKGSTLG